MSLNLKRLSLFLWALPVVIFLVLGFLSNLVLVNANVVFKVQHRYSASGEKIRSSGSSLAAFKAHDARRHGRLLSSSAIVDLSLGGDGSPTGTALYYTKIGIGTPAIDYYVQVDTGSDILWVNCAGCIKCPTKSDLGIKLRLYDPKDSTTASFITCDQEFCMETVNFADCKKVGSKCTYSVSYGDGSSSTGYFVKDNIQFDRASGDLLTTSMNGSIAFGSVPVSTFEGKQLTHIYEGLNYCHFWTS